MTIEKTELTRLRRQLAEKRRECDALRKAMKTTQAEAAIEAVGGNVELLAPYVASRISIVGNAEEGFETNILSEDGSHDLYSAKPGAALMRLPEFLADLREDERFGSCFEEVASPSKPPTRSARRHGGPNPWHLHSLNLTEQMRIAREDPELAKRLQAEAAEMA